MRTAVSKKGAAKPIPLASKKIAVKKSITTTSKAKEVKATTHSSNPVPTIRESSPKTKQSQLIALLKNPQGADIKTLMQATGWQAHSVRGFISGTIKKKLGLNLISQKQNGVQIYRLATDDLNHP